MEGRFWRIFMSVPVNLWLLMLFAAGCHVPGTRSGSAGEPGVAISGDSIRVAAAWTWNTPNARSYARGIRLAVEDRNDSGGIRGLPVTVDRFDDQASVNAGRLAAQAIASSSRYLAVVGHLHSHVSLAVAPAYEAAEMLMLSAASTAPELTRRGYRSVFRTVNSDAVTAAQLVALAVHHGYKRVAICYVRSDYGAGLANEFERGAVEAGIEVIDRKSYDAAGRSWEFYRTLFDDWSDRRFDAILLAGTSPSAGSVLAALRSSGLRQPVFGGDALDDAALIAVANEASEGLEAVTVFHPENPRPEVQRFVRRFTARFGLPPDSWSARGYEAADVLLGAMQAAHGMRADSVAKALRRTVGWPGLHGVLTFGAHGDPIRRPGILIRVDGGRFRYVGELAPGPSSEPLAFRLAPYAMAQGGALLFAAEEVVENAAQDREEDDQ